MPVLAVLAILLVIVAMAALAIRVDGRTVFGPRRTGSLRGAAQTFCFDRCRGRQVDRCPHGFGIQGCPLWKFVDQDLPTTLPLDPGRPVARPA